MKLHKYLLLLLLSLGFSALASLSALAVVGPARTDGLFADHLVMILKRDGTASSFCTAVVISQHSVLTAAHCVHGKAVGADQLRVFLHQGDKAVMMEVARFAIHPDFHANAKEARIKTVDLAVVTTKDALPGGFSPAPLDQEASTQVGAPLLLAGFGLARFGDGRSGGILRSGQIEVRAPLSHLLLWAQDRNHNHVGACTGDSGAPILDAAGEKVLAITAWADGAGKEYCGSLTQGTWVAPFLDWIRVQAQ